jgi:hypothetical protein
MKKIHCCATDSPDLETHDKKAKHFFLSLFAENHKNFTVDEPWRVYLEIEAGENLLKGDILRPLKVTKI